MRSVVALVLPRDDVHNRVADRHGGPDLDHVHIVLVLPYSSEVANTVHGRHSDPNRGHLRQCWIPRRPWPGFCSQVEQMCVHSLAGDCVLCSVPDHGGAPITSAHDIEPGQVVHSVPEQHNHRHRQRPGPRQRRNHERPRTCCQPLPTYNITKWQRRGLSG